MRLASLLICVEVNLYLNQLKYVIGRHNVQTKCSEVYHLPDLFPPRYQVASLGLRYQLHLQIPTSNKGRKYDAK